MGQVQAGAGRGALLVERPRPAENARRVLAPALPKLLNRRENRSDSHDISWISVKKRAGGAKKNAKNPQKRAQS